MPTRRWTPSVPLDLEACVARHRRWGGDPVNTVDGGIFYRVATDGSRSLPYSARQSPGGSVSVTVADDRDPEPALADFKYRMADGLAVGPLRALARRDPIIGAALASRPGYRPPMTPNMFESLITSVTAQQVNLTWATTTRRRLVEAYGKRRRFGGRLLWQFPGPAVLATAQHSDIRAMQFTNAKATFIIEIAAAACDGHLAGLETAANNDVIDRLTEIKGVGRWTAEWALARCLARTDAVAAGDLGVRKAVGGAYLGRTADEEEVRAITAPWADAANWATHLLLEGLSD